MQILPTLRLKKNRSYLINGFALESSLMNGQGDMMLHQHYDMARVHSGWMIYT